MSTAENDKPKGLSEGEDDVGADASSEHEAPDSAKMRALLKRALAQPPADEATDELILRGVQKKIRQRSKGKFYGDGWSTSQSKVSYALVAVTMLVILALAYLYMTPTSVLSP